jgi:hypothetical protein
MTRHLALALAGLLALTACDGGFGSGSGPSSANLFRSKPKNAVQLIPQGGFPQKTETRALIQEVTLVSLDGTVGGKILRATGLPPQQGFWDGELVPEGDGPDDKGVLTYDFRARGPLAPTRVSTVPSREVVVAVFISTQKLAGVRLIRVVAETNSRTVSPR